MTPFHALHQDGLLILPNAWDGGSAALVASLGARAVATTSAGVAWALGWPDGDALPVERVVQAARDVVRGAGGLPVSIDMEGGYSDDPAAVAALAARLVGAGAQGINIEDGRGTPEQLAAKIAAIKAAVGGALFVNARCDVWLKAMGAPETRLGEAARRGAIYASAGADGLFAAGLTVAADIAELVAATPLPVNLLAWPGLPDARTLQGLGVRRLSAGSGICEATWSHAAALARGFLAGDRLPAPAEGAFGWSAINALMPRGRDQGLGTRTNRHSSHPDHGSGEVGEGEEVSGQPVEAGCEASEVLELVEAAFDAIAHSVKDRVVEDRGLS